MTPRDDFSAIGCAEGEDMQGALPFGTPNEYHTSVRLFSCQQEFDISNRRLTYNVYRCT